MNKKSIYYQEIRKKAERMVVEAAGILAEMQKRQKIVNMKDEADMATSADIASEKFLISQIQKYYPDRGIYSEEAGDVTGVRDFLWIIDPLDGTKEYARGNTEYNCLLAIEENEKLVANAMYRNGVNKLLSSSRGNGAYHNGARIRVSGISKLEKALVGFHLPTKKHPESQITYEMEILNRLVRLAYRVRPGWDDANQSSWVAQGFIDAGIVCANVNKWYDISGGLLLVEEAGGMVTDFYGKPVINHNLSHGLVFSNGKIHKQILDLIAEIK